MTWREAELRSEENRRAITYKVPLATDEASVKVMVTISVSCQEIGSAAAVAEVFEQVRSAIEKYMTEDRA